MLATNTPLKLSGAPLPAGASRHETQQPPHRYATGWSRVLEFKVYVELLYRIIL